VRCTHFASYRLLQERQPEIGGALSCQRMLGLSDINISQGSVATHLRCGGIFSYHFTANVSLSLTVKELGSVRICQSYHHEFGGLLFWNSVGLVVSAASERVQYFIMVALCNRADHYIFILFLLLSSLWSPYVIWQTIIFSSCFFLLLFSSPNLSGRKLNVYHTLAHDVALVRI